MVYPIFPSTHPPISISSTVLVLDLQFIHSLSPRLGEAPLSPLHSTSPTRGGPAAAGSRRRACHRQRGSGGRGLAGLPRASAELERARGDARPTLRPASGRKRRHGRASVPRAVPTPLSRGASPPPPSPSPSLCTPSRALALPPSPACESAGSEFGHGAPGAGALLHEELRPGRGVSPRARAVRMAGLARPAPAWQVRTREATKFWPGRRRRRIAHAWNCLGAVGPLPEAASAGGSFHSTVSFPTMQGSCTLALTLAKFLCVEFRVLRHEGSPRKGEASNVRSTSTIEQTSVWGAAVMPAFQRNSQRRLRAHAQGDACPYTEDAGTDLMH